MVAVDYSFSTGDEIVNSELILTPNSEYFEPRAATESGFSSWEHTVKPCVVYYSWLRPSCNRLVILEE